MHRRIKLSKAKPKSWLEKCDFYAPPIRMTYKGQSSHQTKCGGIMSIFFFTLIAVFIIQRFLTLFSFGLN